MRFFFNLPAVYPITVWPFSSFTSNIAFGRHFKIFPLNSSTSSLDNYLSPNLFSIDLACPSKPSLVARVITDGPRVSIHFFVKFISEIFLINLCMKFF